MSSDLTTYRIANHILLWLYDAICDLLWLFADIYCYFDPTTLFVVLYDVGVHHSI